MDLSASTSLLLYFFQFETKQLSCDINGVGKEWCSRLLEISGIRYDLLKYLSIIKNFFFVHLTLVKVARFTRLWWDGFKVLNFFSLRFTSIFEETYWPNQNVRKFNVLRKTSIIVNSFLYDNCQWILAPEKM